MSYDRLATRLETGLDGRDVVTLPDGSVDRYYTVTDASGARIETRSAFVDRISTTQVRSLELSPQEVRAGGEAVNAARQVDALGQSVRLYGHLDDPELGPFPFPTVSMGPPATVYVLAFETHDLMFSVESESIQEWTVEDLFAAVDGTPDSWLTDEVVVLQNWIGFPGMTDALRTLSDLNLGDVTLIFDPGDVTGTPADPLAALCDALTALADTATVVLTANDHELARLAEVLDVEADGRRREPRIREELDVAAVVRHAEPRAVAASESGEVTVVENFDAERVARRTGAGDRFDGALAAGLAADLPWADVLALGNACATYYVEHDETGARDDIRDMLAARSVN